MSDIYLHWKNVRNFIMELDEVFVEIGAGNGHFIVEMARKFPTRKFIAFEYDNKRVKKMEKKILQNNLLNVKIIKDNALWYLSTGLFHSKIKEMYIFFPDPWFKKRHIERRLFSAEFVKLLEDILLDNGKLFFKTDDISYMKETLFYLAGSNLKPVLHPIIKSDIDGFPHTLFEQRFRQQGRKIYATVWEK